MISVSVKFHSNCTIQVNIHPNSTVLEIKRDISQKVNVPVEEVRIILGGKLLTEDCDLHNLNIGQHSTLHIFRQPLRSEQGPILETPKDADQKSQYFVYCKECKSIQPGKLRVSCALCKDGAFVLNRDPQSWEDVLETSNIHGTCKNYGCNGTTSEFVFKCVKSHDDQSSAVILHHVRPNRRHVECITCMEVRSPILVFPCPPGHVICLECFKLYGITQLDERKFVEHPRFGYTLPCPAGCANSEIQESHHFHLLGDQQYARFHDFATEEFVLQTGGVLCPGPGCGMGFVLESAERKVICVSKDCQWEETCNTCGTSCCSKLQMVFCRDCKNEYHEGPCDNNPLLQSWVQDYTVNQDSADRARWETQAKSLIDRTTKPCPKCSTRTERNGGCMHMLCRCGEDWCWVCEKQWDRQCQGLHWFG